MPDIVDNGLVRLLIRRLAELEIDVTELHDFVQEDIDGYNGDWELADANYREGFPLSYPLFY